MKKTQKKYVSGATELRANKTQKKESIRTLTFGYIS